jgi:hypothetical protein
MFNYLRNLSIITDTWNLTQRLYINEGIPSAYKCLFRLTVILLARN